MSVSEQRAEGKPEVDSDSSRQPSVHDLLPQHATQLTASGIDSKTSGDRGYRSVTTSGALLELGFSRHQARPPCLLIPIHGVWGDVVLHQIRPDQPRTVNGKVVKYETPAKAKMAIDVPPSVRTKLGDPTIPLYFTEGVKKADSGASRGLAIVALLGVWNWRGTNSKGGKTVLADLESIALNDRRVFIVFDSDVTTKSSVRKALDRFSAFLVNRGARVTVLQLPDGPGGAKVGLDDYFASGGTVEQLPTLCGTREESESDDDGKPSQAKQIADLVLEQYSLGLDQDENAFVVSKTRPGIALLFKGSRRILHGQIAAAFRKKHRKVTNASAIADALLTLEGEALEKEPRTVHVRVAQDGQDIVLDLGRRDAKVVRIGVTGWRVGHEPNILFRRTRLTSELPIPVPGGDFDELGSLLNLSPDNLVLAQAWVIAGFLPNTPHPILMFGGEQGTGKSTAAEFLVGIFDPSTSPRRSQPTAARQWAIMAHASWGIVIDNVSSIPEWFSDALCKAVTGDGWIDRALYTDAELTILQYKRVIAMTSIHPGALRGDLGERLVIVELETIDEAHRRTEEELRRAYDAARPRLLGAALTLLSGVLRELPRVAVDSLPRMADFARVLAAIDAVRRTVRTVRTVGLDVYRAQLERLAEMVVDSDPIAEAISQLIDEVSEWTGTATQLRNRLASYICDAPLPRSPRAMSGRLRRVIPALKTTGIVVTFDTASNRDRTRLISIQKVRNSTVRTVRTVQNGSDCRSEAEYVGRSSDGSAFEAGSDRPNSAREIDHAGAPASASDGTSDGCSTPTVRRPARSNDFGEGTPICSCGNTRRRRLRGQTNSVCDTCHPAPDPSSDRWEHFESGTSPRKQSESSATGEDVS